MCDGDLDFDFCLFEGLFDACLSSSAGFILSLSKELVEIFLSLDFLSGDDDGDLDFELSREDAESDETDFDLVIPSGSCPTCLNKITLLHTCLLVIFLFNRTLIKIKCILLQSDIIINIYKYIKFYSHKSLFLQRELFVYYLFCF